MLLLFLVLYGSLYVSDSIQEQIYTTKSISDFVRAHNIKSYVLFLDFLGITNATIPGFPIAISDSNNVSNSNYLPFYCNRVHANKNHGICLQQKQGLTMTTDVLVFEIEGNTRLIGSTDGIPNRARMSPDGKYAAYTSFVTGDSYNDAGFSTRSYIVDIEKNVIGDNLERYTLIHNNKHIDPIDKNYWGITFFNDSNSFLVTVMYSGVPYLAKGTLDEKKIEIITDRIECPSLSPDNKKIVFKERISKTEWRIIVMVLSNLTRISTSELENVDDQVEWYDNDNLVYSKINYETQKINLMKASANGDGKPELLIEHGMSPSMIQL